MLWREMETEWAAHVNFGCGKGLARVGATGQRAGRATEMVFKWFDLLVIVNF